MVGARSGVRTRLLMSSPDDVLAAAAAYYYVAADLQEDEDLDPQDHVEVLARAFTTSNCDDFAYVLALATGWPAVRMEWLIPGYGSGHHALLRAPDGRLLDFRGWTDEAELRRRYGAPEAVFEERAPSPQSFGQCIDEEEIDEEMARIAGVLRALPHTPFSERWFRILLRPPIPGADPKDAADVPRS